MRFTKNAGFTLIELLVVITIIGILAVGGTATYTAQIQKARDSTRMTDLNAIRSGTEQFYQDHTEYPNTTVLDEFIGTTSKALKAYVQKIPRDSKSGQTCAKGAGVDVPGCDYVYNVGSDANGIERGRYRVSAAFENAGNVDTKAAKDGGSETNRFEFGLELQNTGVGTGCSRATNFAGATTLVTRIAAAADCATAATSTVLGTTPGIIIAGQP